MCHNWGLCIRISHVTLLNLLGLSPINGLEASITHVSRHRLVFALYKQQRSDLFNAIYWLFFIRFFYYMCGQTNYHSHKTDIMIWWFTPKRFLWYFTQSNQLFQYTTAIMCIIRVFLCVLEVLYWWHLPILLPDGSMCTILFYECLFWKNLDYGYWHYRLVNIADIYWISTFPYIGRQRKNILYVSSHISKV